MMRKSAKVWVCSLVVLAAVALWGPSSVAAQEGPAIPQRVTHWTNPDDVGRGRGPVTDADLRGSDPSSWLHFGGNYAAWRYSPIEELTPQSVADLQVAWTLPTGVPGQLEASPVVWDGLLYTTSSYNRLFAVDAVSGDMVWRYDHQNPTDLRICCGPANRGVAIGGDSVFMATLDARLIAFHRKSGEIQWNTAIDDYRRGLSATSAPLVVGDVVIVGVGGGEFGIRGYFDGYDMATGERRWRHYTVPAAGEPGAETWAGDSNASGGAPTWVSGSYDVDSDTLLWAAGNPGPDWNGDGRAGDNLFSDSVLAVDPSTGERKWHFQFTPHDVWDYDGNTEMWLTEVEIDGETTPVIAQANRNGYFYLLDRRDGRFLRATQYVEQLNWGTIDDNGRPRVDPSKMPSEEASERVCPGLAGGNNGAYSGAFSPRTGLAYVPTVESCMMFQKGLAVFVEGVPFMAGEPVAVDTGAGQSYGHLSAVDVATGEIRWRYRDPHPMMAGALATAGGLVVTGNAEGHILAFDAANGDEVWRFRSGSGIRSHPIAYRLDDRVFLAVGSGGGGVVQEITGSPQMLPQGSVLLVFELAGK